MRIFSVVLVLGLSLGVLVLGSQEQTDKAVSVAEEPKVAEQTPSPRTTLRYWKGNLHTHSAWSDGDDFPEMIAEWYKTHGYDFLSFTEHNIVAEGILWREESRYPEASRKYLKRFGATWVDSKRVDGKNMIRLKPLREFRSFFEEPGKFLLIPGEEITHGFAKRPVHMNGINVRDVVLPLDGKNVSETIAVNIRQMEEQSKKTGYQNLTFLNHPNWKYGVTAEEMVAVNSLRYFEMYNGHPGVQNYGDAEHASTERMWDIINSLRLAQLKMPLLWGVATDDAHNYLQYGIGKVNPGRGWVMVRAPFLTSEAIVNAMLRGDFYCSTGVSLEEMVMDKGNFTIKVKPEMGVRYKIEFIATLKQADLRPLKKQTGADPQKPVTLHYSPELGKVVYNVTGTQATYRLTGDELFVRARVTSSKLHPNPFQRGDVEMAWTQPMVPPK